MPYSSVTAALRLLACIFLTLGCSLACAGNIYTFVDEHGVTNFTDRNDDPRARLFWRDPNGPKGIRMDMNDVFHKTPAALIPKIEAAARAHRIEPALLAAVVAIESRFNPRARSPKGAMGLTQLMPGTAKRYGVRNAYDADQNLLGGAHYLSDLLAMFDNDLHLSIAAFNAGEGAVIKYGRKVPPYAETQHYVPLVLAQLRMQRKTAQPQAGL